MNTIMIQPQTARMIGSQSAVDAKNSAMKNTCAATLQQHALTMTALADVITAVNSDMFVPTALQSHAPDVEPSDTRLLPAQSLNAAPYVAKRVMRAINVKSHFPAACSINTKP